MSKWSWIYWSVEFEGETYVGAYETDGEQTHGFTPPTKETFTLISESQMRALAIEQQHRVREKAEEQRRQQEA